MGGDGDGSADGQGAGAEGGSTAADGPGPDSSPSSSGASGPGGGEGAGAEGGATAAASNDALSAATAAADATDDEANDDEEETTPGIIGPALSIASKVLSLAGLHPLAAAVSGVGIARAMNTVASVVGPAITGGLEAITGETRSDGPEAPGDQGGGSSPDGRKPLSEVPSEVLGRLDDFRALDEEGQNAVLARLGPNLKARVLTLTAPAPQRFGISTGVPRSHTISEMQAAERERAGPDFGFNSTLRSRYRPLTDKEIAARIPLR